MIEGVRRAFQTARFARGEREARKEEEVTEEMIGYPYRLIEPGADPVPAQIAAIKLGVLADRGLVKQIAGDEQLQVKVTDMTQLLKARGERSFSTTISANLQAFIAEKASMPTDNGADLIEWFIRAVELHQTFDSPESSLEAKGPEGNIQAVGAGIDKAWTAMGLPELIAERVPGKFGLTYSRLDFAPVEAPASQSLPNSQ